MTKLTEAAEQAMKSADDHFSSFVECEGGAAAYNASVIHLYAMNALCHEIAALRSAVEEIPNAMSQAASLFYDK